MTTPEEEFEKIKKKWQEDIALLNKNREYLLSDQCEYKTYWQETADVEYLINALQGRQDEVKKMKGEMGKQYPDTEADGIVFCGKCGKKK